MEVDGRVCVFFLSLLPDDLWNPVFSPLYSVSKN